MGELIRAAVNIKDPFTLFAFLAAVLLIAFRTKAVPEALFKLIGEKITRERFYRLVHRAFLYVFIAFLVLCGIAVFGQVLSYKTAARAASLEELQQELALSHVDDNAASQAIQSYQRGLAEAQDQKLSAAIASLESSLKAVPTAAAQETLALLYQKAGDTQRATQLASQTLSTARASGDAIKTAKAERLLQAVSVSPSAAAPKSCPSGASLVGSLLDLPPGGDAFETASLLTPCVYKGVIDTEENQWKYYKFALPSGKTLKVVMRTRDADAAPIGIRLHGPDGGNLWNYVLWRYEPQPENRVTQPFEYKATESVIVFVSIEGRVRGSAFDFSIH